MEDKRFNFVLETLSKISNSVQDLALIIKDQSSTEDGQYIAQGNHRIMQSVHRSISDFQKEEEDKKKDTYRERPELRRFRIRRNVDVTGISGTGIIAEGVELPDWRVFLVWLTPLTDTIAWNSVAFYQNIEHVEFIHGHNGSSVIEWIDPARYGGDDDIEDNL